MESSRESAVNVESVNGKAIACKTSFFLKKIFIYLFIFREKGMEGGREGEKCRCERDGDQLALICAQPVPKLPGRHMP